MASIDDACMHPRTFSYFAGLESVDRQGRLGKKEVRLDTPASMIVPRASRARGCGHAPIPAWYLRTLRAPIPGIAITRRCDFAILLSEV
jgi:hypothetical protein